MVITLSLAFCLDTVTLGENEVCISYPTISSCGSNPINDTFSVSIRDVSGYLMFSGSVTINSCKRTNTIQPYCAPYEVTLGVMEDFIQITKGKNI